MIEINKEDYYFVDEDYDVFNPELAPLNTSILKQYRKDIKDKLLQLNQLIYPELLKRKLPLATHRKSEHITSLEYPCLWNNFRVDWLGIRYGRTAYDIIELEEVINSLPYYQKTKDDKHLGFQKYACLQVNISYKGIDIGIFHSVPNFAVDRMYMHEHIWKEDFQKKLIKEISKLKGFGYIWSIGNQLENHQFNLDIEKAENFISFYEKYDKDGMWSSMLKTFPKYDEKIKTVNITNTCCDIIEQLSPLYQQLIWKTNKNKE